MIILKKEEKSKLTKEKIINAAIKEFGTKSYDGASINIICQQNHISKGLIYHNFKNKDELYLECVRICFQKLTENLQKTNCTSNSFHNQIETLINARQTFFKENPEFTQIFFNSVLYPPKHLKKELKEIKKEHDEYIKLRYKELLKKVNLKPTISLDKAVSYFLIFQEMYNSYFRNLYDETQDVNLIIEIHENKISELLDILLYGLIEPK